MSNTIITDQGRRHIKANISIPLHQLKNIIQVKCDALVTTFCNFSIWLNVPMAVLPAVDARSCIGANFWTKLEVFAAKCQGQVSAVRHVIPAPTLRRITLSGNSPSSSTKQFVDGKFCKKIARQSPACFVDL